MIRFPLLIATLVSLLMSSPVSADFHIPKGEPGEVLPVPLMAYKDIAMEVRRLYRHFSDNPTVDYPKGKLTIYLINGQAAIDYNFECNCIGMYRPYYLLDVVVLPTGSTETLNTVAHELTHVLQFQDKGWAIFDPRYQRERIADYIAYRTMFNLNELGEQ